MGGGERLRAVVRHAPPLQGGQELHPRGRELLPLHMVVVAVFCVCDINMMLSLFVVVDYVPLFVVAFKRDRRALEQCGSFLSIHSSTAAVCIIHAFC